MTDSSPRLSRRLKSFKAVLHSSLESFPAQTQVDAGKLFECNQIHQEQSAPQPRLEPLST